MLSLEGYQNAILSSVNAAGDRLRMMQNAVVRAGRRVSKADGTLVTSADFESERIILSAIDGNAPHPHVVISEESYGGLGSREGLPVWYVDPLDGTKSYASGSTDYAVLVSMWRNRRPIFSVVYYPALGLRACADLTGMCQDIPNATSQNLTERRRVIHVCYIRSFRVRQMAARLNSECTEQALESTRALFDVAIGRAQAAVVLLCGHKSWDLAPLVHLILAAGGSITDEAGRRIVFDGSDMAAQYIVAARDQIIQRELLEVLNLHLLDGAVE